MTADREERFVAGPRARRWAMAIVVVVAVALIVVGTMGIVLGLVGRVSSGAGGLVPDGPAPSGSAAAGDLVPVVSVPDGDTIVVQVGEGTERVRVIGIDTPELGPGECHAAEAAREARALVQGKSVLLRADSTQDDRDRFGRLLRHVALADGRGMAEVLIAGGHGREYTYDRPYAGRAAHRAAEERARAERRGIWSGTCVDRAAPRVSVSPTAPLPAASGACVIKGNIARDGERIFHVPGQRHYDVTRINESNGERWFCTEREAADAGFRAARE